jgi:hypothetical protein
MNLKRVEIGDKIYQVKADIGTAGAIEWLQKYAPEQRDDVTAQEYTFTLRRHVARMYADVPFLIDQLLYDEKGKKLKSTDVPGPDAIRLSDALHESLHIAELSEAIMEPMQRAMEAIDATEDDEDGGSEKNLPTG